MQIPSIATSQEFDEKKKEMREKEQARVRAIQERHRAKFSGGVRCFSLCLVHVVSHRCVCQQLIWSARKHSFKDFHPIITSAISHTGAPQSKMFE
jgi:hypothetical protein